MALRGTTGKSSSGVRAASKAAPKKARAPKAPAATAKTAVRNRAPAAIGGTRAMLEDIRARGEKLTADIHALLHRLA